MIRRPPRSTLFPYTTPLPIYHLAVMRRVQAEHLHFAIAGGGIGVVKGLSELPTPWKAIRSEEHTSELQSRRDLVCRLLLEKKKNNTPITSTCTASANSIQTVN